MPSKDSENFTNFCMAVSRGFTVVVIVISHTGRGVVSGMSKLHVIPDIMQQKLYHLYFKLFNFFLLFRNDPRIWTLI